jgi:hypothetical protein
MAYKAKSYFSFGGKVYQEGQEITETNEEAIETLEKQGFIAKGEGKPAAEFEQERSDELEKKGEANRKLADEASRAEEQRLHEAGKNSVNTAKFKTIDQTKSTKTVADTAKSEKVEVPAKKAAKKK